MQRNTKELWFLGILLFSFLLYPVYAADNDTDFNSTRTQVNQLQATDPQLPTGVSQPKGLVGDILAKMFNPDGKIGTRFLSIFAPGSTTINPVFISGATITGLNATNISTGTINIARIPDNFLRNDVDDIFLGKLSVGSTNNRDAGIYGAFDSTKIGHIWSMGAGYRISATGATFGNLYGFAYKHTNNPTGGTMAGGHQAVWTQNGIPNVAIGTNIWTSGTFIGNGSTLTNLNATNISTGTLNTARLPSDVVKTTGDQGIGGTKNFTNNPQLSNTSPTVYLRDTDHRSAMMHVNSNQLYLLRGDGTGSTTWSAYNGMWPLQINLENNNAVFGGKIGIGTTNPTEKLDINGTVNIGYINKQIEGARLILQGGDYQYRMRVHGSDGRLTIFPAEASTTGYIGEPFVFTKDGKLGINVTFNAPPTEKLDVNGKIRMRTQTTASDSADIVATKGYVDSFALECVTVKRDDTSSGNPTITESTLGKTYDIASVATHLRGLLTGSYYAQITCTNGWVLTGCTSSTNGDSSDNDTSMGANSCNSNQDGENFAYARCCRVVSN